MDNKYKAEGPEKYDPHSIEEKWQKIWDKENPFRAEVLKDKGKYYILEMFPYPSGRIHMGHVRNYAIGDVAARFKWRKGCNVLHPMGWDAFGMPAENAAIENQIHPATWTYDNIGYMRKQLKMLGLSYDWERELATCKEEYYKWNQWFFLKLYEKGLAYRKESSVNWCESCKTVLANEQVEDEKCWRCESEVIQKEMKGWFLRITSYAEELLSGLNELEGWPHRVLTMQENWIGKSIGAEILFPVKDMDTKIPVFTTRQDTIFGATFMSLAPEHQMVSTLTQGTDYEKQVKAFAEKIKKVSKQRRTDEEMEKEGIFTGRYCLNPITGWKMPVYVANFVLMDYGTGAVMAVPAHDQRDFEFAKKYDLPIKVVIQPPGEKLDGNTLEAAYVEEGILDNSGEFSGIRSSAAMDKIVDYFEGKNIGKRAINYKLKDWGISRQRYWGTPIPMIYCQNCGIVPVPEKDLPVVLPTDVELNNVGDSPLKSSEQYLNVPCPECNRGALRETDTMDTFVDSSWYFMRYCSPKSSKAALDKEEVNYWMPVDQYIGGIEHAVLHLLYARFFIKLLRDLGLTNSSEPFSNLLTQGMVIKDAAKMSKSKGNVVDPDGLLKKYGADTVRTFCLFASPPEKDLDWNDEGVEGVNRFLNRVWRLIIQNRVLLIEAKEIASPPFPSKEALNIGRVLNKTIKKVTDDIDERFHFNTAIASIMELVNFLYLVDIEKLSKDDSMKFSFLEATKMILSLLSPFAPHITEELWCMIGNEKPLFNHPWPSYDPEMLKEEEMIIVIQINGKVRSKIVLPVTTPEEEIKNKVMNNERIKKFISNKEIVKTIYVPNRLINLVCK